MQGEEGHHGPWTEQELSKLEDHQRAENRVKTHVEVFIAAFERTISQAAPLAVTGAPVETVDLGEVGGAGLHCSWLCPVVE